MVASLLVPHIHSQLCVTADTVERATDIVRYGHDDLVTHFKQLGIFAVACLQFAATTLFTPVVTHNYDV